MRKLGTDTLYFPPQKLIRGFMVLFKGQVTPRSTPTHATLDPSGRLVQGCQFLDLSLISDFFENKGNRHKIDQI